MLVLAKEYSIESIIDLERDISEMLNDTDDVTTDENGLCNGTFIVTIEWKADES